MYCENQPRYHGKSFEELFPDECFPNETPEDLVRSESCLRNILHAQHDYCVLYACIYMYNYA